jgi:hypothetical protein
LVGCEDSRLYSKEKEWETQGKETEGGGKERFKKNVMVLYIVMIHWLAEAKFDELPCSTTEIADILHLSTTDKMSER